MRESRIFNFIEVFCFYLKKEALFFTMHLPKNDDA